MTWYDLDFWKKLAYSKGWKPHMEKVEKLHDQLERGFPELGFKFGHGAKTDKWLRVPPDEKFGPDLTLFHEYKMLCYIEVSGSPKISIGPSNPDIWVLLGKHKFAKTKKKKYWFWMVYKNGTWLLDEELVERYEDNVQTKYIKRNKWGRRVGEEYICIPYTKAYPTDRLFDWIKEQIE